MVKKVGVYEIGQALGVYRDWRDAGGEASRAALLHTTYGTPNYEAPEVLVDKGYDGKMANSLRAARILAGVLPFDEPTMSALFRKT
jgi:5'-AMP-activated protein kinase catalytic alpha subunit